MSATAEVMGDYIPKVNMDEPCKLNPAAIDEERMGNIAQHFRAKLIEKAMSDGLEDKGLVALALQAAGQSDKQTMDKRKLEVMNKAVDNEAEAIALINTVTSKIKTNPWAVGSTINVDAVINDDEGKLPEIQINPGALEVGVSSLNYETFMSENNINPDDFIEDDEEENT